MEKLLAVVEATRSQCESGRGASNRERGTAVAELGTVRSEERIR